MPRVLDELGLKALADAEGKNLRGHKLSELFAQLSPDLKTTLMKSAGLPRAEFDAALAAATHTFVDWRYVHEQTSPRADIEFLRSFGSAVQNALLPVAR